MKPNRKLNIFLCLLLSCLFVFNSFSTSAYAQEDAIIALDISHEIIGIAPDGQGGFYALSSLGIEHFSWESKAFESVPSPETGLLALSWDGTSLVGICGSGEGLYRLTQDEWRLAFELDEDSPVRQNMALGNVLSRFVASPDFFLITYYDLTSRQEMTCIIDSITGKSKTIDQEGFYPLCLYENQSILAMAVKNEQYGVFRFDLKSGQLEPFTLPKLPLRCIDAAYDPVSDTLYVVDEAGQLYVSHQKGEAVLSNNISGAHGFAALSDEWVAFLSANRLYLCDTAKMQNAPILTILGSGLNDNTAFTAATGIRVVEAASHYSVMEHMSLAMTTKDSTVDIYGFNTYQGLDIVKRKGMFYDLRKSQVLSELSQELYPKVLNAIQGPNGELVCWFIDLQVILRMDEGAQAVVSRYGLKYPNTFEELLDAIQTLKEMGVLDELNKEPFDIIQYTQEDLLSYFMQIYIMQKQMTGDRLHFDTPTFRRIVTRIMTEIPTVYSDEALEDGWPFLFTLEIISPTIHEDMQPPIQVDADTPAAIHTLGTVNVINPASAHLEEALAYLEYAAQIRDDFSYNWYATMTEPMRESQVEAAIAEKRAELEALEGELLTTEEVVAVRAKIQDAQSQITTLESAGWIVSPQAIANYHEMADRLFISEGMYITLDEGIKSYQARLLSGLIDIPEFIRLCEQRALMIYAEQGY